jgi:hypothetical protein
MERCVRQTGLFAPVVLVGLALAGCGSSATGNAVPRAPREAAIPDRVADLCAGVAPAERERPFFFQQASIESVHELTAEMRSAKFGKVELRGAEIALRPSPAGTRHHTARVLRCHLAWHDAVALVDSTAFEDPLAVGSPDISIDETEAGLVMRIAGHDRAEGEEILRRAEALVASPTASARE